MDTQAIPLTPANQLYADLATHPPVDRRLFNEEIQGIIFLKEQPTIPVADRTELGRILADRKANLEAELAAANIFLDLRIKHEVHHQLRLRPDFQTGEQVVEQWVPALNYWLTSARFPDTATADFIIAELQAGDPRFKTPAQRYAEEKERAAAQTAANDKAGDERIAAAVDSLGSKGITQFLEVERAIRTGEKVVAHGDDERFLESAHQQTVAAAGQGDREAQVVLERGISDNKMCVNPGHNPVTGR